MMAMSESGASKRKREAEPPPAGEAEPPDVLRQVGALPIRNSESGGVEVLLVTSRETGRWIIPKGWPMRRMPDHKAAAREALEEAGVEGDVKKRPIGTYTYFKRQARTFALVEVAVYLLRVERERKRYSEMNERRKQWMRPKAAAEAVLEPELATLIRRIGREMNKRLKAKLDKA